MSQKDTDWVLDKFEPDLQPLRHLDLLSEPTNQISFMQTKYKIPITNSSWIDVCKTYPQTFQEKTDCITLLLFLPYASKWFLAQKVEIKSGLINIPRSTFKVKYCIFVFLKLEAPFNPYYHPQSGMSLIPTFSEDE